MITLSTTSANTIVIDKIVVSGNRKTKTDLILREIDVHVGDTIEISDITSMLERNQNYLMNTGLFNSVVTNIRNWDETAGVATIHIVVLESWYFFPLPVIQLADRNFNVWWTEQNRSLDRLTYGIKLLYYNATGNNDLLKIELLSGYNRKLLFQYSPPYINKTKTLGTSFKIFTTRAREVNYGVEENKQLFFDNEEINWRTLQIDWSAIYRPGIISTHSVELQYRNFRTTQAIQELNPSFFIQDLRQTFLALSVQSSFERRNNRYYPTRGHFVSGEIRKEGFGIWNDIDKLQIIGRFSNHFMPTKNTTVENRLKFQKELLPGPHPFYGLNALGFGEDYVHGYELFIISGTDYFVNKNAFKLRLFDAQFNFDKLIPLKNYRLVPLSVWLTANLDFGYTHSELLRSENDMNDRLLIGRGIGIDFILYEKYVFQIEYSSNHINQDGVFFHIRTDF